MQSYNGFYYDVNQPRGYYRRVQIFDGTRSILHSETRPNWSYAEAERYAIDYIDQQNTGDIGDEEYDDLPPSPVDPVRPINIVYPHTMYDCDTGMAFQARTPSEHQRYEKRGFVHDLSECKISPPSNGDNGLLETAGVFVVGVAKGTLIAAVPITAMAVAVGFMRRIVKFGVGVSS
tara:strand:+ start:645 stop:1172 length:528 start_codon:yes stop_codon:yes gene_type:complete